MYDLIIIGAGPAGLTAAIYALRRKMAVLVFEHALPGGQINVTSEIENYPGFRSIKGMELAEKMVAHAKDLGMELRMTEVKDLIRSEGGHFTAITDGGNFDARAVIFATGARYRSLGIPGEEKFLGKGVSYCATCDGPLFRGKRVAVVGGGDSALIEALYLAELASEIYIIHRRAEFRAEPVTVERVRKSKIKPILESEVKEVKGDNFVKSIMVENVVTKERAELPVDGIFIYIGNVPSSAIAKKLGVQTDPQDFIVVDRHMRTYIPGIFAAGDITHNPALQAIAACGEGAIAAISAYEYVKGIGK